MFHPSRRDVLVTLGGLAGGAAIGKQVPYLRGITASATSQPDRRGNGMPMITTKDGAQIFYKDWGPKDAQPIVFHHGWPLSSDDWDAQMLFFLANGYRVVAHDRRGHGRSSQVDIPATTEFSAFHTRNCNSPSSRAMEVYFVICTRKIHLLCH
jgi:non-heme chloroperoxidase